MSWGGESLKAFLDTWIHLAEWLSREDEAAVVASGPRMMNAGFRVRQTEILALLCPIGQGTTFLSLPFPHP